MQNNLWQMLHAESESLVKGLFRGSFFLCLFFWGAAMLGMQVFPKFDSTHQYQFLGMVTFWTTGIAAAVLFLHNFVGGRLNR